MYKVFVRIDEQDRITEIQSHGCAEASSGSIEIDEGDGDRYQHAQGNYLPKPLMDELGRYRYKLVDGAAVERAPEEMTADAPSVQIPNMTALLQTQVQALSDRNEFMEDCIAEMASVVYGDA